MDGKVSEVKDDKVWLTISRTVNLGNYESYKIEAGYSQTIGTSVPLTMLERMEKRLHLFVVENTEKVKGKKKKRYRAPEPDDNPND